MFDFLVSDEFAFAYQVLSAYGRRWYGLEGEIAFAAYTAEC
jgi:hypothetical protein